jgi:hypothetical protein
MKNDNLFSLPNDLPSSGMVCWSSRRLLVIMGADLHYIMHLMCDGV